MEPFSSPHHYFPAPVRLSESLPTAVSPRPHGSSGLSARKPVPFRADSHHDPCGGGRLFLRTRTFFHRDSFLQIIRVSGFLKNKKPRRAKAYWKTGFYDVLSYFFGYLCRVIVYIVIYAALCAAAYGASTGAVILSRCIYSCCKIEPNYSFKAYYINI